MARKKYPKLNILDNNSLHNNKIIKFETLSCREFLTDSYGI